MSPHKVHILDVEFETLVPNDNPLNEHDAGCIEKSIAFTEKLLIVFVAHRLDHFNRNNSIVRTFDIAVIFFEYFNSVFPDLPSQPV